MKKYVSVVLAIVVATMSLLLTSCEVKSEKTKYNTYYFDYFDTVTTIIGYAESQEEFDKVCAEITTLLNEYHRLFNIYNRYEGLNNLVTINDLVDGKHTEVQVDKKIIDMLTFAKEMYYETDGNVNIAMGSVLKIWHIYRNEGLDNPVRAELPPMEELEEASKHTNIDDLIINTEKNTVFLKNPLMSLDVGAIAKGYAVEQIAKHLETKDITGYILNVGGNVRTIGMANGDKWKVGIENSDTEDKENPYIEYLKLSGESVVTSGTYQRFYVVNGENYHHIIDPETLMPGTKFISVSVITNDSGLGDAMSTALFLMDYEEGKKLVELMENIEAMWVFTNGEQRYSSGFENYTFEYVTE
ncbi:MAG: FAD:protein FMN transferase [Clostridia bacterium]|nr:FAD:protein FMN transferase [Clostridia bacterium]